MVSLTDFQPQSVAKINIFHEKPGFHRQRYYSVSKSMSLYKLHYSTAAVSKDSQV